MKPAQQRVEQRQHDRYEMMDSRPLAVAQRLAVERRRHDRYEMTDLVFADRGPNRLGAIVDIGMGGLSFQYLLLSNGDEPQTIGTLNLGIFRGELGICLSGGISCTVIYDVAVCSTHPNSRLRMRRTGVQFGALSQEQLRKLKSVMQNYTVQDSVLQSIG
jgi:hypothetical protein